MKIFHFCSLIILAFKTISWAKVSNLHQTSNGWAFLVHDILHGDDYVCCAYPIKSTKLVVPNTVDELLAMTKEKSND